MADYFPKKNHFLYFCLLKPQAMRAKFKSRVFWEQDLVGGVKIFRVLFSHLNRLVHKFAAKFKDLHGAAFADSMVHWLLIV